MRESTATFALQARPGGKPDNSINQLGAVMGQLDSWSLQAHVLCRAPCPSTAAKDMTMNRPAAILVAARELHQAVT